MPIMNESDYWRAMGAHRRDWDLVYSMTQDLIEKLFNDDDSSEEIAEAILAIAEKHAR